MISVCGRYRVFIKFRCRYHTSAPCFMELLLMRRRDSATPNHSRSLIDDPCTPAMNPTYLSIYTRHFLFCTSVLRTGSTEIVFINVLSPCLLLITPTSAFSPESFHPSYRIHSKPESITNFGMNVRTYMN